MILGGKIYAKWYKLFLKVTKSYQMFLVVGLIVFHLLKSHMHLPHLKELCLYLQSIQPPAGLLSDCTYCI